MSYEVKFRPKAVDVYDGLPLSLLDEFDRHIEILGNDPIAVAVPAAFPHPANRMIYHFELSDFEGIVWYFGIHFRYSPDETSLDVIAIVVNQSDGPL